MTKKRMETAVDLAASLTQFYASALTQPAKALTQSLAAGQALMNSLAGTSEVKPDKGDKRFRDPVWASNPAYKNSDGGVPRLVRGADQLGGQPRRPPRDKLRAKLVSSLVTDALAPTNAALATRRP